MLKVYIIVLHVSQIVESSLLTMSKSLFLFSSSTQLLMFFATLGIYLRKEDAILSTAPMAHNGWTIAPYHCHHIHVSISPKVMAAGPFRLRPSRHL